MKCPHCSELIADGSRFCPSCGRPVVSAVAHSWDTTDNIKPYRPQSQTQAGSQAPAQGAEPTQVLPTSANAAPGAPTQSPYSSPYGGIPNYHPHSDIAATPAAAPQVYRVEGPEPRSSWKPILGALLGLLVIAAFGIGAFLLASGQRGNDPVTSPPVTQQAEPNEPAPAPSTPAQPNTSTTASKVKLPSGSRQCGNSSEGYTAHAGNDQTTCPFAEAVRKAWSGASSASMAKLEVRSPVTGQNYQMSCSGTRTVTCTGGDSAVVYLVRDN